MSSTLSDPTAFGTTGGGPSPFLSQPPTEFAEKEKGLGFMDFLPIILSGIGAFMNRGDKDPGVLGSSLSGLATGMANERMKMHDREQTKKSESDKFWVGEGHQAWKELQQFNLSGVDVPDELKQRVAELHQKFTKFVTEGDKMLSAKEAQEIAAGWGAIKGRVQAAKTQKDTVNKATSESAAQRQVIMDIIKAQGAQQPQRQMPFSTYGRGSVDLGQEAPPSSPSTPESQAADIMMRKLAGVSFTDARGNTYSGIDPNKIPGHLLGQERNDITREGIASRERQAEENRQNRLDIASIRAAAARGGLTRDTRSSALAHLNRIVNPPIKYTTWGEPIPPEPPTSDQLAAREAARALIDELNASMGSNKDGQKGTSATTRYQSVLVPGR